MHLTQQKHLVCQALFLDNFRSISKVFPPHLRQVVGSSASPYKHFIYKLLHSLTKTNLEFAGVRQVGRPQSLRRLSVSPVPGPGPPVARGTKPSLIATRTVNVSILTDINILRPDALLAGGAGRAFLMINSASGGFDTLVVEHLAVTARAAGILVLLLISHDGGGAQQLESVATGHVAPLGGDAVQLGVAVPAGDLHVRGVARQEGIQRPTVMKDKLRRLEEPLCTCSPGR